MGTVPGTWPMWVCGVCGSQDGAVFRSEIGAKTVKVMACGGKCYDIDPKHGWHISRRTEHVIEFLPNEEVREDLLYKAGLVSTVITRPPNFEEPKTPVPVTPPCRPQVTDVNWELLPADTFERQCALLRKELERESAKRGTRVFLERLTFYEKMQSPRPLRLLRGLGAFHRYFGVQFSGTLVVLDNIHEGNAIYIMLEEWETLSRMSKTKLLETREEGRRFVRIVHSSLWKERIVELLPRILAA